MLNAARIAQLEKAGLVVPGSVSASLLAADAFSGLQAFLREHAPELPGQYRLAFRELGLSLGINTVASGDHRAKAPDLQRFEEYVELADVIESFWLLAGSQAVSTWRDHLDINAVTLAASRLARVAPHSFA